MFFCNMQCQSSAILKRFSKARREKKLHDVLFKVVMAARIVSAPTFLSDLLSLWQIHKTYKLDEDCLGIVAIDILQCIP